MHCVRLCRWKSEMVCCSLLHDFNYESPFDRIFIFDGTNAQANSLYLVDNVMDNWTWVSWDINNNNNNIVITYYNQLARTTKRTGNFAYKQNNCLYLNFIDVAA